MCCSPQGSQGVGHDSATEQHLIKSEPDQGSLEEVIGIGQDDRERMEGSVGRVWSRAPNWR